MIKAILAGIVVLLLCGCSNGEPKYYVKEYEIQCGDGEPTVGYLIMCNRTWDEDYRAGLSDNKQEAVDTCCRWNAMHEGEKR